ncbi:MAG: SCP2 sterol-binding domain-containing protein [Rhodothermales bacterium]|nr:SCP2 sterol-binding domain-containing protein [Rhodothermales bacterium]
MPIETISDLLAAYDRNFVPERAEGIEGTVQLNLTGEDGGNYVLHFADKTYRSEEGEIEDPTVRVTADTKDWMDVSLGNVNPMMLMMKGKLKVKGSVALATKFQSLFKGK